MKSALISNFFKRQGILRMRVFKRWTDEQIKSITLPVLIVNGDQNDILLDHVIRMHRLFQTPASRDPPRHPRRYMGEAVTANVAGRVVQSSGIIVEDFLER